MLIKLNENDSVTVGLNHSDNEHVIVVSNHNNELYHREFRNPKPIEFPKLEEIRNIFRNTSIPDETLNTYITSWLEDNNVI
ncbi:MAG: hypothetical protein M0R17_02830 [Candidatus Omnitrophica bacterium]|jgi:hypothetical protein|nr:hypothetical protein [Candidatus Omnitrophota bacterium]